MSDGRKDNGDDQPREDDFTVADLIKRELAMLEKAALVDPATHYAVVDPDRASVITGAPKATMATNRSHLGVYHSSSAVAASAKC